MGKDLSDLVEKQVESEGPSGYTLDRSLVEVYLEGGVLMTSTEVLGSVGKPDLASSGHFSIWLHPAVSTIKPTSPASPSLPGERIARSRADDGVFRQSQCSPTRNARIRLVMAVRAIRVLS